MKKLMFLSFAAMLAVTTFGAPQARADLASLSGQIAEMTCVVRVVNVVFTSTHRIATFYDPCEDRTWTVSYRLDGEGPTHTHERLEGLDK